MPFNWMSLLTNPGDIIKVVSLILALMGGTAVIMFSTNAPDGSSCYFNVCAVPLDKLKAYHESDLVLKQSKPVTAPVAPVKK